MRSLCSSTSTFMPSLERRAPQVRPPTPEPMMTTSYSCLAILHDLPVLVLPASTIRSLNEQPEPHLPALEQQLVHPAPLLLVELEAIVVPGEREQREDEQVSLQVSFLLRRLGGFPGAGFLVAHFVSPLQSIGRDYSIRYAGEWGQEWTCRSVFLSHGRGGQERWTVPDPSGACKVNGDRRPK